MAKDQSPPAAGGVREIRQRASERLGRWIRKKYRLDSLLGVGGMAAVYAATHRNGSRMAIKMLHGEFAGDDSVRERFLREGYVANKVTHPGRVAIIDDDETDEGEPFLVMELLDGRTLQQLWKKQNRKLDVVQALSIAEDVLDTLIPFHELTIIHRDLKPANIFVTKKKEVKLLDFGVAQLREAGEEALTRAGSALGTPSYMSPEQAMGKSEALDGRSDVYAMGATLYAVLSGNRLYHDMSDNEAFILAATQPAPSIARAAPDLPVEVITLVDKALQWDRRNRFADAKAMRDACRQVGQKLTGGSTPSATPESTSPTGLATLPTGVSPLPASSQLPARQMAPTPLTSPTHPASVNTSPSVLTPHTLGTGNAASRLNPLSSTGLDPLSSAKSIDLVGSPGSHPPGSHSPGSQQSPEAAAKMKEIFTLLDRAMPTLRQYGGNHPESVSRIGAIHRTVVTALRTSPQGISWSVLPFCFSMQGQPIWEPGAPTDCIPYTLSAAGVEKIAWLPGITEQELRTFSNLLALSFNSDNEDTDMAELIWEARLDHVHFEIGDDSSDDGHDDRSLTALDDIQAMAREDLAEAAAMAYSTDTGGSTLITSPALSLDPHTRMALASQLSLDPARWQDRYFDVLIAGYVDAVKRGDPIIILNSLASRAERLLRKGDYQQLYATHHTLLERLNASGAPPEASGAMLTAGIYSEAVLKKLLSAAYDTTLAPDVQKTILNLLRFLATTLDVRAIHGCIKLANRLPEGEPLDIILEYIQRAASGQEEMVVAELDSLRPAFAQKLLATIVDPNTPQGKAMLTPLLTSRIPALRCEALALLAKSPEHLKRQLLKLTESTDAQVLFAALNTMVNHQVRAAGPGLIRLVESEGFVSRPRDQQQKLFKTLWSLNSERGEAVLISVIEQMHGLMADETVDRTRSLAAEVLSEHASSDAALEALANATRRRPWNTPDLRAAAAKAIECIEERLAEQDGQEEEA